MSVLLRKHGRVATIAAALIAACFAMSLRISPDRPLPARGGSYRGVIEGVGTVQLDLFLGGPWDLAWLFHPDNGQADKLALKKNGEHHTWTGEWVTRREHGWLTNATFRFALSRDSREVTGTARRPDGRGDAPFALRRTQEHVALRLINREPPSRRFDGWMPASKHGDKLGRSVSRSALEQGQQAAVDFVGDRRARPHDPALLGWPAPNDGENAVELWQPRLQTDRLRSYAVWNIRDSGGSRNLARWRSWNVWWNGREAVPFTLRELFDPDTSWKDRLRSLCGQPLEAAEMGASFTSSSPDWNLENFTLGETGLQIYFDDDRTEGGRTGGVRAHIDYAELRPLFARTGPATALVPARLSKLR